MNKNFQKVNLTLIAALAISFVSFFKLKSNYEHTMHVAGHEKKQVAHAYGEIESVKQFNDLINSAKPTVIKFSSPACVPCRQMIPAFNAVAKEYGSRVQFFSVDTSLPQLQQLSSKCKIGGLPTVIYFSKGKEILRDRKGALTKPELVDSINQLLSKAGKSSKPAAPARAKTANARPKAKRVVKSSTQQ